MLQRIQHYESINPKPEPLIEVSNYFKLIPKLFLNDTLLFSFVRGLGCLSFEGCISIGAPD